MVELWTTLIPLALGSAIIPVEIALTILVLKAPGGVPKALAWVGGMTVVRLAQWVILGPVVDIAVDDGQPGTSLVEGALLLVVGILFLVIAARKATDQPDEDAPPPGWMAMMDDVSAGRAFLMGAALIREGLARVITDSGGEVVAKVGDGPSLVRAVVEHRPDVSVVDVRMPPTQRDEGLRAAIEARRLVPGAPVLVLSQYVERQYATELLANRAGGVGFGIAPMLTDLVVDVKDSNELPDSSARQKWRRRANADRRSDRGVGAVSPHSAAERVEHRARLIAGRHA